MKTLRNILMLSVLPLAMACGADPLGPSGDQSTVRESRPAVVDEVNINVAEEDDGEKHDLKKEDLDADVERER